MPSWRANHLHVIGQHHPTLQIIVQVDTFFFDKCLHQINQVYRLIYSSIITVSLEKSHSETQYRFLVLIRAPDIIALNFLTISNRRQGKKKLDLRLFRTNGEGRGKMGKNARKLYEEISRLQWNLDKKFIRWYGEFSRKEILLC